MMCPKCGKEMRNGYLFSSKDGAFSFASEVPSALENAKKIIKEQKYGDTKMGQSNVKKNCSPHVITPEEFGELYDYEKVSLIYYADGVLTDEDDNIVDDVDGIVGIDSLNMFGQYEEDSVYVRNDERRCDYEILMDERKYHQVKRPKI